MNCNTSIHIEPSLLSADFAFLGEAAISAAAAGATAIHVDVMDGQFVPQLAFGPGIVQALRRHLTIPVFAHLMVIEPERYLQQFADAGAQQITVHQEVCPHLYHTLQQIRKLGMRAGVAINPGTPFQTLIEVLEVADTLQVMTVNPGRGGQTFFHCQLRKISRLRQLLINDGLDIPIAVDGGIDPTTVPLVVNAGAQILIAGSSIFNEAASVAVNIEALRAGIDE